VGESHYVDEDEGINLVRGVRQTMTRQYRPHYTRHRSGRPPNCLAWSDIEVCKERLIEPPLVVAVIYGDLREDKHQRYVESLFPTSSRTLTKLHRIFPSFMTRTVPRTVRFNNSSELKPRIVPPNVIGGRVESGNVSSTLGSLSTDVIQRSRRSNRDAS
jgi:hypothetical protein